jgi:hypothetical protein
VKVPDSVRSRQDAFSPVHLLPLVLLLLVLVGVMAVDWFVGGRPGRPVVFTTGHDLDVTEPYKNLKSTDPRLGIDFDDRKRFGIVLLTEKDPKNPEKFKRLTYEEKGSTNNTCVKVDGHEYLFGNDFGNSGHGKWLKKEEKRKGGRVGWDSVFEFTNESIVVTQSVDLVPGDQTRLLDTVLVRYAVENKSKLPHTVGIRVMLDTFIGANDGVPFAVPGSEGKKDRLVDTLETFDQKDIPEFVQALERPDLNDPGTVAHLGLKLPDFEPLHQMVICRWPGNKEMRWKIDPLEAMRSNKEKPDSCVVLYWAYDPMNAGEVRKMAFTYGLNTISSAGGMGSGGGDGKIALTTGGSTRPGREFTVTAYVKEPQEGQTVRLILPEGFSFAKGHDAEKKVEGGGDLSQVSWRVRSGKKEGDFLLEAASGASRTSLKLSIREESLY